RLEAETGVSTNWKQVGSLGVARRAARMTQFRRSVALGRYAGIEAHIVDRDEIRRRWPLCRVDDLEGGIWIPHDGRVIPADTTQALAAGARAGGARIVEETAVREVLTRDGAVAGVRTSHGEIACDVVVNCAGMWARELGALNGIPVPGLRGYFIAAGFNSGGIAYSGGAGRALAEWIVGGHMPMDLWSVDPRRFAAFHGEPRFLAERMREVPGLHYRMAWPLREHETGRGLLRSALHERLAARGASFGARMGWERANWLTGDGAPPA